MKPIAAVKVRSLFLSDVHLGTHGCQAERLLDFLGRHEAERIYLVGDIVDGWRLRARWYWPPAHDAVVALMLEKIRAGALVRYLPGNHDAFLRAACNQPFIGIEVVDQAIHEAADGRRYLVLHGDRFDLVCTHARWLALLGDLAYRLLLAVGRSGRRPRHPARRSLSRWAKHKVKEAVNRLSDFENKLAAEARRHNVQGVICGHSHHAAMHDDFGLRYINTGDWVESCTAAIEHFDGRFEVIHWVEELETGTERHRDRVAALCRSAVSALRWGFAAAAAAFGPWRARLAGQGQRRP